MEYIRNCSSTNEHTHTHTHARTQWEERRSAHALQLITRNVNDLRQFRCKQWQCRMHVSGPLWYDWHTSALEMHWTTVDLVDLQISVMALVHFSSVQFGFRVDSIWFGLVWYGLVWFVRLACRCRLHLFVIIHAFVCYFNDCVWFMSFDVHSFFARLPVWLLLLLLVGQLHVIGLHGRTLSSQAQRILSWFLRLVARLYRLLPLVNYATHENK